MGPTRLSSSSRWTTNRDIMGCAPLVKFDLPEWLPAPDQRSVHAERADPSFPRVTRSGRLHKSFGGLRSTTRNLDMKLTSGRLDIPSWTI